MKFTIHTISDKIQDSLVTALLLTRKPDDWLPTLKKCLKPQRKVHKSDPTFDRVYKKAMLDLGNALVQSTWTKHSEAKNILKKICQKKLAKFPKELQATFIKIRAAFEKSEVLPPAAPPPRLDPNCLKNLGSTCWMNTLLQHFRTTHDYDALLRAPVNARYKDEERAHLIHLQQKLEFIVTEMRQSHPIQEADLKELATCFTASGVTKQNGNFQHDATEVINLLQDRFGNALGTIERTRLRKGAAHFQEEPARYLTVQVHQNGETVTQLLTAELCNHTAELRNSQTGLNEVVEYTYQISAPPMLQVRIKRPGHYDREKNRAVQYNVIHPTVERTINLKAVSSTQKDEVYDLGRVMCRNNSTKSTESSHFWYYAKEGGTWVKYDDNISSKPTDAEVQQDFDKNAYALFYYKPQAAT